MQVPTIHQDPSRIAAGGREEINAMTLTEQVAQTTSIDPYRDIHKGIRTVLFSVTTEAGRIDPADRQARGVFADYVYAAADMLEVHAAHEDRFVQPVLEEHAPALALEIAQAHASIAARVTGLRAAAEGVVDVARGTQRSSLHQLYLDFALFTSAYLEHQEMEERIVTPTLLAAIGNDELRRIDEALVASIPPDTLAAGLAVMLPAMNIDDRAEMLAGMKADAPPQVFAGVWVLARSVLDERDTQALADRLGL
jgi:Hemerythrin HHE cation binding domain